MASADKYLADKYLADLVVESAAASAESLLQPLPGSPARPAAAPVYGPHEKPQQQQHTSNASSHVMSAMLSATDVSTVRRRRSQDGWVPPEAGQNEEAWRWFAELDADRSGALEKPEFELLLKKVGLKLKPEEVRTAFREMDVNRQNAVSFLSFVNWWTAAKARQIREQRQVSAMTKSLVPPHSANTAYKR